MSPAGGHAYPRLPALDVRLHSEVLCLSWDFMMLSCLCLRSSRMARNSSSSHRSARTGSDVLTQKRTVCEDTKDIYTKVMSTNRTKKFYLTMSGRITSNQETRFKLFYKTYIKLAHSWHILESGKSHWRYFIIVYNHLTFFFQFLSSFWLWV